MRLVYQGNSYIPMHLIETNSPRTLTMHCNPPHPSFQQHCIPINAPHTNVQCNSFKQGTSHIPMHLIHTNAHLILCPFQCTSFIKRHFIHHCTKKNTQKQNKHYLKRVSNTSKNVVFIRHTEAVGWLWPDDHGDENKTS